ncbi:MAG: flagellar assembly protein FliW [Acidobacteriota bacterium]|jgi:flagellar assembly factor FliW|nr:flagellar assembly protein FliW [Acidobacteriota bacterium]
MRIHTVNFGDLEIAQDIVITFKEGLPGFPQLHSFAVLELEELKPFQYLQALPESLDDPNNPPIALYLINPFLVDPGYEFHLTDSDMEDIHSKNSAELTVYAVATIPESPADATLNLMAPIVINERDRCGKQVILHDSKYSVRHPLLGGASPEPADIGETGSSPSLS